MLLNSYNSIGSQFGGSVEENLCELSTSTRRQHLRRGCFDHDDEELRLPITYVKEEAIWFWSLLKRTKNLENAITLLMEVRAKTPNYSLCIELIRLCAVLSFRERKYEYTYETADEVICNSLLNGPSYNEECADKLKYSQRKTFWYHEAIAHELYGDYPFLEGSIDYLVDPQYLIHWELNDPEDYKLYFEPALSSEDEDVNGGIAALLNAINVAGKIEYMNPDILDNLEFLRSSKCYDMASDKNITNYENHLKNCGSLNFTNRFIFKRVFIQKNAGETRDALVAEPETLHTIVTYQNILKQIFPKLFKEYKLFKFDAFKEFKRLPKSYNRFMMTDLSKCGINYPRKFLLEILDILRTYVKHDVAELTYQAYLANPTLMVDGKPHKMTNGVGLGMFSEIVTVGTILAYRYGKTMKVIPDDAMAWMYNDDQVIMWNSDEYVAKSVFASVQGGWNNILRGFGIKVHDLKPFCSDQGCFLEKWTQEAYPMMEKRCRQYNTLLNALKGNNIVAAKEFYNQHHNKWWGLSEQDNADALSLLIDFWGYEFHKDEEVLPFEMGGWYTHYKKGMNNSLCWLIDSDEYLYPPKFAQVMMVKKPKLKYRPWAFKKKAVAKGLDALNSLKNLEYETTPNSWNERVDTAVESCEQGFGNGYRQYRNRYYKLYADLRQKAFKSGNKDKYDYVKESRATGSLRGKRIPSGLISIGTNTPGVKGSGILSAIEVNIPYRVDLNRIIYSETGAPDININKGAVTNLVRFVSVRGPNTQGSQSWKSMQYRRLYPFLKMFSSNPWSQFEDLCDRYQTPWNIYNVLGIEDAEWEYLVSQHAIYIDPKSQDGLYFPWIDKIFYMSIKRLADKSIIGEFDLHEHLDKMYIEKVYGTPEYYSKTTKKTLREVEYYSIQAMKELHHMTVIGSDTITDEFNTPLEFDGFYLNKDEQKKPEQPEPEEIPPERDKYEDPFQYRDMDAELAYLRRHYDPANTQSGDRTDRESCTQRLRECAHMHTMPSEDLVVDAGDAFSQMFDGGTEDY
jgi:hypothetical protein